MKKLIFEKENNKKQTNSLDEEESESSENDLKIRFLLFWQKSKSFTWTFLLESESFFYISCMPGKNVGRVKSNFQYLNLQYAKTELSYQLSKHILENKSSALRCCTSVCLGLLFPKGLS